jgi:hypothetical protein
LEVAAITAVTAMGGAGGGALVALWNGLKR